MARRMFSPEVVCADAFLDMPPSTQALYFQLGMHADDDGFVGPKKIMRMISAADDELKLLIGKRFVIPFDSGVIVIKHWRVNNLIRKDWYRPSIHIAEKGLISFDKSGVYHLVNELAPNSLTQVGSKVGNYKGPTDAENANADSELTTEQRMQRLSEIKSKLLRPPQK